MRFLCTLHMPSYNGNLVHQVNVEHVASNSLEEFTEALTTNDFVIVDEYYRDPQTNTEINRGQLAINHRFVGKIKVMNGESFQNTQIRRDRYDYRKQSL